MNRSTSVASHLSLDEVKMKMRMTGGLFKMQKWLVIYNAIIDPRPVSEIALHTGLSESSVTRIIAEYNRMGPEALESISNGSMETFWMEEAHSMSV